MAKRGKRLPFPPSFAKRLEAIRKEKGVPDSVSDIELVRRGLILYEGLISRKKKVKKPRTKKK